VTARDKVVEAIKAFNWGNYSLDEVALGLADYPEYQQWPDALADAVLTALDAQPFHTIDLCADRWTLKHPLDCRDDLFGCAFNKASQRLAEPPGPLGVYRVELGASGRYLVLCEKVGEAGGST